MLLKKDYQFILPYFIDIFPEIYRDPEESLEESKEISDESELILQTNKKSEFGEELNIVLGDSVMKSEESSQKKGIFKLYKLM